MKKHIIAKGHDIPDIGEGIVLFRKQGFERGISQAAGTIWRKIAEVALAADIDAIVLADSDGSNDSLVREGVVPPIITIECQEALIVGKIHHAVAVLNDSAILGTGIIDIPGVVNNIGDTDGILATAKQADTEANRGSPPFQIERVGKHMAGVPKDNPFCMMGSTKKYLIGRLRLFDVVMMWRKVLVLKGNLVMM